MRNSRFYERLRAATAMRVQAESLAEAAIQNAVMQGAIAHSLREERRKNHFTELFFNIPRRTKNDRNN